MSFQLLTELLSEEHSLTVLCWITPRLQFQDPSFNALRKPVDMGDPRPEMLNHLPLCMPCSGDSSSPHTYIVSRNCCTPREGDLLRLLVLCVTLRKGKESLYPSLH